MQTHEHWRLFSANHEISFHDCRLNELRRDEMFLVGLDILRQLAENFQTCSFKGQRIS